LEKSQKTEILSWGLLYFLCALCWLGPFAANYLTGYPDDDKYYPLWATDLFAKTPYITTKYSIKVLELDNEKMKEPVDLYVLFPTKDWESFSPSVVIDSMGRAYEHGKKDEFEKQKENFQRNQFRSYRSAVFSLNRSRWKPIEKYTNGGTIEDQELVRVRFERK
jgi:hypothetical protein